MAHHVFILVEAYDWILKGTNYLFSKDQEMQ